MNDFITNLLNIVDDDSIISDCHIDNLDKVVTIEKRLSAHYCPYCNSKMLSKGKFSRFPNNQILQDGYKLKLILIGRKWLCPSCGLCLRDQFPFLQKYKRNTKLIPLLIINELKDLNKTCIQIANKFNVSDTYVHNIFLQYVNPKRKKLSKIISIDEVYLNIDYKNKYSLIIMDFISGEIIDILPSRREDITNKYFLSIPIEERNNVLFLITDLYNPYIKYTYRYFLNAKSVCDSFHVLQWLLNMINNYINNVKRKYIERDKKIHKEKYLGTFKEFSKIKDSKEVHILKKAKWVLLANSSRIKYQDAKYDFILKKYLDTYQWKNEFLNLDSNFRKILELKQIYEDFNNYYIGNTISAEIRLNEIINIYSKSELFIFQEFSRLLKKYKIPIINSFTTIDYYKSETRDNYVRRLSNGPIESFNNKPSKLRSNSHGVSNFEFTRNRILWSSRKNEPILLVPRSKEEIYSPGKSRGKYNKDTNK